MKNKEQFSRREFLRWASIVSASVFLVQPGRSSSPVFEPVGLYFKQLGAVDRIKKPIRDLRPTVLEEMLPRRRWVEYFDRGTPNSGKFAITLDDGWDPDLVDEALEVLSGHGVSASLFPVGTVIAANPKLWRGSIKRGFELHNHTYSHQSLGKLTREIKEQLTGWEREYNHLGCEPYRNKLIRPPQNKGVNNSDLYSVAYALGYKAVVGWMADSKAVTDNSPPEKVLEQVKRGIVGGGVVLLHFVPADIAALPLIIDYAKSNRLTPVKLSQLPGSPIYTRTLEPGRKNFSSWIKR